jgi:hypothetical protein
MITNPRFDLFDSKPRNPPEVYTDTQAPKSRPTATLGAFLVPTEGTMAKQRYDIGVQKHRKNLEALRAMRSRRKRRNKKVSPHELECVLGV